MSPQLQSIVVVDFGSQYTRLIARRLRELGVYSAIVGPDVTAADLAAHDPAGVILSGGPRSVSEPGAPGLPAGVLDMGLPVLAVCYGMQLVARERGGRVVSSGRGEYGKAVLKEYGGRLFEGVEGEFVAWMSHGDSVAEAPPGFAVTAVSESGVIAAMEDDAGLVYCLQFHPEVRHTPKGSRLLERFVERTGVPRDWTPENIVQRAVEEVRATVGDERVLLAVSGGVDSSTLALLLTRAIGDRLVPVFVDHGLLRLGEAEEVELALRGLGVPLRVVDARRRFLGALKGVTDPEEKRKVIGREFIRVFEEEARTVAAEGEVRFLAQGTLYPDVIESATPRDSKTAAKIKTHHNVGGLPEDLQFELLEPVRMLFKDEVRAVGRLLGLPEEIVQRQPFPGPGLAVRILGEVTPERLKPLRRADAIVRQEIEAAGLGDDVWQFFAVLLPVKSTGVMGDQRTYADVCAIRAVTSEDAMTADWARLPHDLLARMSNRIVNEVPGINRVVYDITSKPPGTIEWE